ncbi:dehydratase family protein, partial [Vibrio parahaemolyticus V-223/04]
RYCTA